MGAPEIQPVGARKKRRTGLIVVIVVLAVVVLAASAVAIRVFVVAHGGTQFCQTFIGMKSQMTDLGQQMQDAVITGDFDQIGTVLGQMSDTFDQLRGTNPPASVEPALETIIDELDSMQQATSGGPLAYLEYLVVHGDDITTTFTTAGETFEKEAIAYCS
jgi:hypothetical protein